MSHYARVFLVVIFLPLFSVCLLTIYSRRLGHLKTAQLAVFNLFLVAGSALYEAVRFFSTFDGQYVLLSLWVNTGSIGAMYSVLEDGASLLMLLAITMVSAVVHLFAKEYMKEDPHLARFMLYLTLFTFFIIVLVTADNYLQLFLGWEGVGFLSYLLINFWYLRVQANKSAIKAMLVNRVGDFGLFLGLILLFVFFKSSEFSVLFAIAPSFSEDVLGLNTLIEMPECITVLVAIALCFFIGAIGKSAQIGLHIWLPDAMEGPTPVSALIHAATMVTAGIYVTLRSSALFEAAEPILCLVMVFGAITAFFSAIMACFQTDIKKTIAYSTCSQLGYMFVAAGVSYYSLSLFHLFNHAFFKALCFVSAGAVIHTVQGSQDVSEDSDEFEDVFQSDVFSLASSALSGTLFLSGYFSKDFIIDVCGFDSFLGNFVYFVCLITVAVTAVYTMGNDDDADEEYDAYSYSLYSQKDLFVLHEEFWEGQKAFYGDSLDCDSTSTLATLILLGCSLCTGFIFFDVFVGVGAVFFAGSSFLFNNTSIVTENSVLLETVVLSIALTFVVGLVAVDNWNVNLYFFRMAAIKLYIDKFINYVNTLCLRQCYNTFVLVDKGLLEIVGPVLGTTVSDGFGGVIKRLQPGLVWIYLLYGVFGLFILFILIEGYGTLFYTSA